MDLARSIKQIDDEGRYKGELITTIIEDLSTDTSSSIIHKYKTEEEQEEEDEMEAG